jgi:presqualene diphosphate synthase
VIAQALAHFETADQIMRRNARSQIRAPRIMSKYYRAILDRLLVRGFALPRAPVRVGKLARLLIIIRYAFI